MPTNDFQELVHLIERSFYPSSAKIACPAFVQGQGLDEFREVDILITDKLGPRTIKIAVEATDLGRPLGIGKFEAFLAKYRGEGRVAVHDFYIVTRKGFTEDVKERAMLADVELITLEEAKSTDWPGLANNPSRSGKWSVSRRTDPYICDFGFIPSMPGLTREQMKDVRVRCDHGTDFGTAFNYAAMLFFNRVLKDRPEALQELSDTAAKSPKGRAHLRADFPMDHRHYALIGDTEHAFESFWFQVHKNHREESSETQCYQRTSTKEGTRQVMHTKATTPDSTIEIAMEMLQKDGQFVPPKSIALKLGGSKFAPILGMLDAARKAKSSEGPAKKPAKGRGKRKDKGKQVVNRSAPQASPSGEATAKPESTLTGDNQEQVKP